MADAKTVTILNQREGKLVLPADADELKKNPKTPHRVLLSGQALTVSAADAAKFLRYAGVIDASKLVAGAGDSAEVKALKAQLAAAKAENATLKKGGKADKAAPAEPADEAGTDSETDDVDTGTLDAKKGVPCTLPDGTTGVIQSVNKAKKTAKVKRDDNGNVSDFKVADLKPAPTEAAAK